MDLLTSTSLRAWIYGHDLLRRLKDDQRGVTLLEYSIMIGLITALVVSLVAGAGTWAQGKWQTLAGALGYTP